MKKLMTPLLLALLAFSPTETSWNTVTLLEKVTISLPGTPTEDKAKGVAMQKVVMEDGSEFNAFAMDYSTFGMTEEMLQAMAGTEEFKEQMETGIGMQPGVKIIKNEAGKYNEKYFSFDMALEMDNENYKGTVYQRTVFYKQYGITLIYKPGNGSTNNEMKDKVFNTLKIEE